MASLTATMLAALLDALSAPLVHSMAGWTHRDAQTAHTTGTVAALAERGLLDPCGRSYAITATGRAALAGITATSGFIGQSP